jgi:NRAMP (natural resistance-associated macrophage protein)-like metal ion transporter
VPEKTNSKNKPSTFEKIASAPAKALDSSIKVTEAVGQTLIEQKPIREARWYWHILGPGLTTGAADDDPSGIATYSQTGSQYGLSLLWLAAYTFPLMAVVQEMCARIGLVTGKGLAANIRKHFSKKVLYGATLLLFVANTFNLGADLGAMSASTRLLFPNLNFYLLVIIITIGSLALQIFTSYKNYAKYLKWMSLMLLVYILTALSLNLKGSEIFRYTLLPSLHFNKDEIFLICGILGTTISPYLFFWQTSQEVEEEILEGKTTLKQRQVQSSPMEIKRMRIDNWTGMLFSNMIMFFIILTCGQVLFKNGITNIQTAAQAATALRPLAGQYAYLLFTIGVLGVGLMSVPVLAGSSAYAISESFGWKEGLYRKLKTASAFYGVIIIGMTFGMFMNFFNLNPITCLIYAAVLNGLVAPVMLILIMKLSSSEKVMGCWTNGRLTKIIGWITISLMVIAGLAVIWGLF